MGRIYWLSIGAFQIGDVNVNVQYLYALRVLSYVYIAEALFILQPLSTFEQILLCVLQIACNQLTSRRTLPPYIFPHLPPGG